MPRPSTPATKALYAAGVVSKETMEADEAAQGQYLGAIESDKAPSKPHSYSSTGAPFSRPLTDASACVWSIRQHHHGQYNQPGYYQPDAAHLSLLHAA